MYHSTMLRFHKSHLIQLWVFLLVLIVVVVVAVVAETTTTTTTTTTDSRSVILVVGSGNLDTFLPIARLPTEGENLTLLPGTQPLVNVPGGKGCTQAVAAAKLLYHDHGNHKNQKRVVSFCGHFGYDGAPLAQALQEHGVDLSHCHMHEDLPSGRGYVFVAKNGSVSAVVSGGSNIDGWNHHKKNHNGGDKQSCLWLSKEEADHLLDGVKCILLQREVPEYVNLRVAQAAKERSKKNNDSNRNSRNENENNILVLQDGGGEDRPISSEMLQLCDFVIPNESELCRLVNDDGNSKNYGDLQRLSTTLTSADASDAEKQAIVEELAKRLQAKGARNVLVTQGSRGSTMITENGETIHQPTYQLSPTEIVDETGAGDCYRAAFAVALLEGHSLQQCMQFASAAGSCSVTAHGAIPSTPSRKMVEHRFTEELVLNIPRGKGQEDQGKDEGQIPGSPTSIRGGGLPADGFPFLIGSRLNSMKDRPELWPDELKDPRDYVKRQATIPGLTCVDFNYPQHFKSWTTAEAKKALDDAGLVAGAVCLRYPSKFCRGSFNNPDAALRGEAIELTKQAAQVALDLGCNEVVVWSAYDGYDYPFQVNYDQKWKEIVTAFQSCCDEFPNVKFSLEYKPTDENTRFFTVPTTAAALLLVEEIDRPNMGLTLDVGHMLMAGENPGQSIAMVGAKKKLFGIQLNDGFTRLAAEDGLMFGSVHPSKALEIMYYLKRTGFDGHFYFDTFPQRTDPVKEAEYNIRQVKRFWKAAVGIDHATLAKIHADHDAVGALELVNEALRRD